MAKSSAMRVGVITAVQFAGAMTIVLWPAVGWAQKSAVQATFTPAIEQKVDARSEPAKVTNEEESVLTSNGYVKIGTIRASSNERKANPKIIEQLESAILQKAAVAGGDVVHLYKEGQLESNEVTRTKYSMVCSHTSNVSAGDGRGGVKWTQVCDKYEPIPGTGKDVTKTVYFLVSEGTVWRNDAAGDIARAAEAAREADRKAEAAREEATRKAEEAARKEQAAADAAQGAFEPLEEKLSKGQMGAAELLLAHGADVNAKDGTGKTYLCFAAENGQKDAAELLLAHGADVNAKCRGRMPPLLVAAYNEHGDLFELLLAHGADVNAMDIGDIDKPTALAWMAFKGHRDMVELLMAHGADVNLKEKLGQTPLYEAAWGGHADVAELLLTKGADVNAKNQGLMAETPLHRAAFMGYRDVAELLLAHGADVNAKDAAGETPLRWAERNNQQDMVRWLRQHGAKK
jgi:ankyrin repeat protein